MLVVSSKDHLFLHKSMIFLLSSGIFFLLRSSCLELLSALFFLFFSFLYLLLPLLDLSRTCLDYIYIVFYNAQYSSRLHIVVYDLFYIMTTRSNEVNEEITAGNRPIPATNGEWNQQTIFDARNVLQTQQSNESSQQTHEPRSGKSKILFYFTDKFI